MTGMATMTETLLEVEGVDKSFPGVRALHAPASPPS
jgi:ribose transport system ATP-binding protein